MVLDKIIGENIILSYAELINICILLSIKRLDR